MRWREADSDRILVLAPKGRDAALTGEILGRAGLMAVPCSGVNELCARAEEAVGVVLLTEESLDSRAMRELEKVVNRQEPWSDLPIIVFSASNVNARLLTVEDLGCLGNLTILDRPVRVRMLLSAVRAGLRSRHRQYEARRTIQLRDEFLAMLGHELRNPLGAIVFATELVNRGGLEEDKLRKHVEVIARQTRHLARLVDDLLDVARVTSGKVVLKRENLDLRDVIQKCLQVTEPVLKGRFIHTAFAPASESATVIGDSVRLEQVFSNLVTNAAKYTPEGGRVEVSVESSDGEAIARIRDNGVGIEPEALCRIFELFMQAETTIDRSQGGMGIGLTLVRRLVELHGGRVEAASEGLGKGSVFTVYLPLVEAKARPTSEAPRPIEQAIGGGRKIAIIEDCEDIRVSLRALLEAQGHSVGEAPDGTMGVALILEEKPDVALIDIGLPELDGYEVARRVRDTMHDRVFLIAMTGYGGSEDRRKSKEAGFDAHLTKPIDLDTLEHMLEDVAVA